MDELFLTSEMQLFAKNLEKIIYEEDLYSDIGCQKVDFEVNDVLVDILFNFVDVQQFVASSDADEILCRLNLKAAVDSGNIKRLVFAPCSPLFDNVIESLCRIFSNVALLDSHRSGSYLGGVLVSSANNFIKQPGDFCIILTRNTSASKFYENFFGKEQCYNSCKEFIRNSILSVGDHTDFIRDFSNARKPVLFVSPRPLGTLSSTIMGLALNEFNPFWLGAEEIKDDSQVGYSTPKNKDMAFQGFTIGDFVEQLKVLCSLPKGQILYHFEAIFPPLWDFSRAAICYAATIALIQTVKQTRSPESSCRFLLHMYDAIKPGVKNYHSGGTSGRLYKRMISEAEGIVFSSYTESFGDFVENAVGFKLNRVHSHRYQTIPKNKKVRLKNGYHVAILSVMLEEFWEPSRMGLIPYLRNLLAQGIHLHYYASIVHHDSISKFVLSLPTDFQPFFHLHLPIHDLDELSSELSQYHAGWSLFNMQIFNDMTTYVDDQFTKDAMGLFTPTTLPSVIWSCAAAGLPVICNRAMQGVVDILPDCMTIPLTLSELPQLKSIFEGIDWNEIDNVQLDSLDISNQIYKLVNFLNAFQDQPEIEHVELL